MKLICHIREARSKAVNAARAEILALLRNYDVQPSNHGPLSDQPAVFWIEVPDHLLPVAEQRFPLLGYISSIDILEAAPTGSSRRNDIFRYHGKPYVVRRIFREDEELIRSESPDKREFLLTGMDGRKNLIKGYRGTDTPGKRRGLPACDARLLVNLVTPHEQNGKFLDPFAGAGSIVQQAVQSDMSVFSADVDATLAAGLSHLGSEHRVSDARKLPFDNNSFDAIAAEPPFDRGHGRAAIASIPELNRVLALGGRIAVLCARWQTRELLVAASDLPLTNLLNCPVDRKGLKCSILSWEKCSH